MFREEGWFYYLKRHRKYYLVWLRWGNCKWVLLTWTIAIRKRSPRRPMAMAAIAITDGPTTNRATIDTVVQVFPQATILGCNAMNKPIYLVSHPRKYINTEYNNHKC